MWTTVEQIKSDTGVTVDETTRNLAAQAIERKIGLIEAVPRADMSDRDLYWLRMAVAYQAAWLIAQPDYLERNDVSSVNQDGQSVTGGNADWLALSPHARTYLKRLSWRGPRGLNLAARPGQGAYKLIDGRRVWDATARSGLADVNSEEFDDALPWRPM